MQRKDSEERMRRLARLARLRRLRHCMKTQPAASRRRTKPPTAMPAMAGVVRTLVGASVNGAEGSTISTVSFVKTVELSPRRTPAAGC